MAKLNNGANDNADQKAADSLCSRLAGSRKKSPVGKGKANQEPPEGKKVRSALSSERPRRKDEGKRSKDDTATSRLIDKVEGTSKSPQRRGVADSPFGTYEAD